MTRNGYMLKRPEKEYFDLFAFFEGNSRASGVFEDRAGRLRRRFDVDITGQIHGTRLSLHERFQFDDGEIQTRTWSLQREGSDRFSGTAADCIGAARGGFGEGMAWMNATLRLPVGRRTLALDFGDVFYPAGVDTLLNRSTVSKWGLRIGTVLMIFRKG